MFTPCPGLRIPRSKSDANTCAVCADGLPSYAVNLVRWPSSRVDCFARPASPGLLSTRRLPIETWRCLHGFFFLHTVTDGTDAGTTSSSKQRGRQTAPGLATETGKRSLWALPALRAWETPVPAPLGYMVKAQSDMRPGRAGRSPVSQAAAQPRDSQPTASHQLCCRLQCVRLVQLLECRVQAGTWYNQVLSQAADQGGRAMYSTPPPHPKSAGGLRSRGPHPPTLCLLLLQPALSVSGLLGPGSRSGSWSFSSHVFPPSFPSIIALFNRSARPTPPVSLSRASLFSSRRLPVIVLRIPLPLPD